MVAPEELQGCIYLSVHPQQPTNTLSETEGQIERERETEKEFSRTNSEAEPEPSRGQFLKHRGEGEIRPLAQKESGDARMLSVAAAEGKG